MSDDYEDATSEETLKPPDALLEGIKLMSLSGISKLNLSGNSLKELPKDLSNCAERLEELDISSNDLQHLPVSVCQLKKLRVLDVGNANHNGNKLESLPLGILELQNLGKIVLNRNAFVNFPGELCHLQKLEEIHMEGNKVSIIPTEIRQLRSLRKLNIADNKFQQLPDSICDLVYLRELDVSRNNLERLPKDLRKLRRLQVLKIRHNMGLRFPYEILGLTNLEVLHMNDNNIKDLPASVGDKLSKLKELKMEKNQISELPESICKMGNLISLNISNNVITSLPQDFGNNLPSLENLEVSNNYISYLPNSLCNLSKLYKFIADRNNIINLPKGFFVKLTNLTILSLKDNPIRYPPAEILDMDIESIRAYEMQHPTSSPRDRPSTSHIRPSRPSIIPTLPDWLKTGGTRHARPKSAMARLRLERDAEKETWKSSTTETSIEEGDLDEQAADGDGVEDSSEPETKEDLLATSPTIPVSPIYKHDQVYHMDKKPHGLAVIFSNEHFTYNMRPTGNGFAQRHGTQIDIDRLTEVFKYLNYKVRVHKDLTLNEMRFHLDDLRCEDHSDHDSFICCILSHGRQGSIITSDGQELMIHHIERMFSAGPCWSLRGKPKIFIIQACRGRWRQAGYDIDAGDEFTSLPPYSELPCRPTSVPEMADFLFGYATVENRVSYRSATEGSIYIEKLTSCLHRLAKSNHLLDILTEVNKEVSDEIIGEACGGLMVESRQVPAPVSTLRGKVYFKP